MIAHYARIHDSTIREAFDRYQRQRVNIAGAAIGYDPDARVPHFLPDVPGGRQPKA